MREQIQVRLDELKREFEAGQGELQQLQARENYLREAILRISGAIQVLEELLTEGQSAEQSETDHHNAEPLVVQTN